MKRRLSVLMVCCLVAMFLMASLASAKSPKGPSVPPGVSGDGTIYGCFKKVNGQLRIVSGPNSCRPSEVSIFWNQEGLPDLLTTRQASDVTVTLAGTEAQVLLLTVPAGTYAISAKVSVANADLAIQTASCALSIGGVTGDVSGVVLVAGEQQVISLLDAAALTSETDITLSCTTFNGSAGQGVLSAIEVGNLLQQP